MRLGRGRVERVPQTRIPNSPGSSFMGRSLLQPQALLWGKVEVEPTVKESV